MTTPKEISDVVVWTFNPEPRNAIHDRLKALSDDQLNTLMTTFPGAAGTLGWLEYGRRKGYIASVVFDVVEVKGEIVVKADLDAPVVVENITLDSKWSGGN